MSELGDSWIAYTASSDPNSRSFALREWFVRGHGQDLAFIFKARVSLGVTGSRSLAASMTDIAAGSIKLLGYPWREEYP